jgi:thiamine-phosphate pyrophosphorylase
MSVLLYYITDRSQFPGDESARRAALLAKIAEAGSAGVDYIQIREKDLFARELASLAQDAVRVLRNSVRPGTSVTRLLINSRSDIALTVGAEGVHLRSDDISTKDVRDLVARSGMPPSAFVIGISCHSPEDVRSAESAGADFAVFAPVFEKKNTPHIRPSGLRELADACRVRIPVIALGGVTLDSAAACIEAGAAGIAAIRLFQDHPVADVVRALRR